MKAPAHGKTMALIGATAVGIAGLAYTITSSGSYLDPMSRLACEENTRRNRCE